MPKTYDCRFYLIVEQILAFTSGPNMVREVKNLAFTIQIA